MWKAAKNGFRYVVSLINWTVYLLIKDVKPQNVTEMEVVLQTTTLQMMESQFILTNILTQDK